MNDQRVRFVDLHAQYAELAGEIDAAIAQIVENTAFIGGAAVSDFEDEYAAFSGVRHCVGVASGTDALELALRACDIGPGDEVILPANTFIATAEAVARAGATPVLVDCDETHLMAIDQVADRIGPRTRAVMPVHLYGQMASMSALESVLSDHPGVTVIEDAAQAHGASQAGRPAGGVGRLSGTSFYPGKNLGAFGDAGAVLTDDDATAERVRLLRDHGSRRKYEHEILGFNCRLDALQAAVLRVKLTRLAGWNLARGAAAARYEQLLGGVAELALPVTAAENVHVWHLYVVELDRREHAMAALQRAGIETGIHYPVPVHLQPAFRHLADGPGAFPVSERAAARILSLPMHPHVTADDQARVAGVLVEALQERSG